MSSEGESIFEELWRAFLDSTDRAARLGVIGTVEHLVGLDEYDIDLAYTVVLVNLAMIDNDFAPRENYFIKQQLIKYFDISYDEALRLVKRAQKIVSSDKKLEQFGHYLRDRLSESKRKQLINLMDELSEEDKVDHPFEEVIRKKYREMLE